MLPFLKARKSAGSVMAVVSPEGSVETESAPKEENEALMSVAEDLIRAIHSKDAKAVADALAACHELCSYDSDFDEGA